MRYLIILFAHSSKLPSLTNFVFNKNYIEKHQKGGITKCSKTAGKIEKNMWISPISSREKHNLAWKK
jgi:hypothetical protein